MGPRAIAGGFPVLVQGFYTRQALPFRFLKIAFVYKVGMHLPQP